MLRRSKGWQERLRGAANSCAATSKADAAKDAWLYLPKGTCEKIVGGSLIAAAEPKMDKSTKK